MNLSDSEAILPGIFQGWSVVMENYGEGGNALNPWEARIYKLTIV